MEESGKRVEEGGWRNEDRGVKMEDGRNADFVPHTTLLSPHSSFLNPLFDFAFLAQATSMAVSSSASRRNAATASAWQTPESARSSSQYPLSSNSCSAPSTLLIGVRPAADGFSVVGSNRRAGAQHLLAQRLGDDGLGQRRVEPDNLQRKLLCPFLHPRSSFLIPRSSLLPPWFVGGDELVLPFAPARSAGRGR
jgi:hypothetical protein